MFLKKEIEKDKRVICYSCIGEPEIRTDIDFVPIINLHKKYKELDHITWCNTQPRIRKTIINQLL